MRYSSERHQTRILRRLFLAGALFLLFWLFLGVRDRDVFAAKKDADVVLIGDSYAAGANIDVATRKVSNPWPTIVTKQIGTSQYLLKCKNGTGFLRTVTSGANFFTLLRDAANAVNTENVQKVVVVGGYNDQYRTYYELLPKIREFIAEARGYFPHAEVIIGMSGWNASDPEVQYKLRNEVYPAYRDASKRSGAYYIDGIEEVLPASNSWYSSDQYHPNEDGHRLIGNYVAQYIKEQTAPLVTNGLIRRGDTYVYLHNSDVDASVTKIVKNNWNGNWYFMRDGVFDASFTGLAKSIANDKWYFVRKGILDWNFTGLAKSASNGKWYFVRNGKLDRKFTGVAKSVSNGKWYYVKKGKRNLKYTGLAKSATNGKWYYVKKGKVNWKFSGRVKGPDKKWHLVRKGRRIK